MLNLTVAVESAYCEINILRKYLNITSIYKLRALQAKAKNMHVERLKYVGMQSNSEYL